MDQLKGPLLPTFLKVCSSSLLLFRCPVVGKHIDKLSANPIPVGERLLFMFGSKIEREVNNFVFHIDKFQSNINWKTIRNCQRIKHNWRNYVSHILYSFLKINVIGFPTV
jgi:hypothetical protein